MLALTDALVKLVEPHISLFLIQPRQELVAVDIISEK
jgi:hypothetical protein